MLNYANINIYAGPVGRFITAFETKKGTPALRFSLWVGHSEDNGFWQECVLYGRLAEEFTLNLTPGDWIHIVGKKRKLTFTNKYGLTRQDDCCVANTMFKIKKSEWINDKEE